MIELWQFLRNVLFSSCKWPVDVHVTLGLSSDYFYLFFYFAFHTEYFLMPK